MALILFSKAVSSGRDGRHYMRSYCGHGHDCASMLCVRLHSLPIILMSDSGIGVVGVAVVGDGVAAGVIAEVVTLVGSIAI